MVLVGGYFAASQGSPGTPSAEYLVNAIVLSVAFWFPAVRLEGPRDLRVHWRSLVVWLLAWTLVWDLATAGVVGSRAPFQEWWLVYPSGVGVLMALLGLHVLVVRRFDARSSG